MIINNQIIEKIEKSKNVAIYVHIRPDGDCLGAATALKCVLKKMGKIADIFCDGEVGSTYDFLPDISLINVRKCDGYDLAVAVDCADETRLGGFINDFYEINNTIKIDHHKSGTNFAKINFVENVGSTCEILYFLFKQLNAQFDENICCALYCGIAADTGCFMHDNVTSQTHSVVADIMNYKFDFGYVNYKLFKCRSLSQINLLKQMLNNMLFICDKKVAISYLTINDFKKNNAKTSDTIGMVNNLSGIDTVDIGVLISEDKPGLYTCSFRSKGNIDVSVVCQKFGGGGHLNASGCNIFGGYKTVISKIEKVINEYYAGLY